MKKTIITVILLLIIVSCKAQIIAVENLQSYNQELPDGAYIKDVNNVLGKFVGTWKGTYNSKNYEFRIVKFTRDNTKLSPSLKFKEDLLLIRYKITDANGAVLEDTTTLPNDNPLIIEGNYLAESGSYVLTYQGKKDNCGQNGDVFIRVLNNTNNLKMKLFLNVDGEMLDCDTPAQQILPTDLIDLAKQ